MVWIISTSKEILVNLPQLSARHSYIGKVTGAEVTPWHILMIGEEQINGYLCCQSNDNISGTVITAHIGQVCHLCSFPEIVNSEFVIANTCIWNQFMDKLLLRQMRCINRNAELWFAKQELYLDSDWILHQSTVLAEHGCFGFQSTSSERDLFRYRNLGLRKAIERSFERVSPFFLSRA